MSVGLAVWRWTRKPKSLVAAGLCVLCLLALAAGCVHKDKGRISREGEATRNLGVALMNDGRYRAALREFLKAKDLAPKDAEVRDHLGLVLLALGRPGEAVEEFQAALRLDPEFYNARNNLGAAYLALKDWDKAIPVFEELMGDLVYPTPWKPAAGLGWAYFNKGDLAKAEEWYLTSVDQSPSFAVGWRGLGRVYAARGRLDRAVEALSKAVEIAPKFAEAYYDLGEAYWRAGRRSQAMEAFSEVCSLVPGSELCRKARLKITPPQRTW